MRCLLLTSLLYAASAALPSPGPFDDLPLNETFSLLEDLPEPPFGMGEPPLNVILEDGSVEDLFEGDIILTREQRLSRKADLTGTWPGGVVSFVITSSSSNDRAVILSAIDHWRSATCLTFVEKLESYQSGPHLRFIRSSGCWSYVGRVNRSSGQPVSIGPGCAYLGTVAHEIGHAIGFWHEQSRRERDSHVSVLTENVATGYGSNFQMATAERALGVPYDLSSDMHYGGFGFSKNGFPTIVTNDLRLAGVIGQREGLSHRDKQLANLLYNCDAPCTCPPICRSGGYLNKDCACACPPGTGGNRCETITGSYYGTACGDQDITSPGTITSPNHPALYPPGKHCVWIATAPEGKRVRIQFGAAKVIPRSRSCRCYWDWVALHLDDDSRPEHVKCGSELQDQVFTSEGRRLALELHTYRISHPSVQTGFTASVTFV